jgi:hypothetical protein
MEGPFPNRDQPLTFVRLLLQVLLANLYKSNQMLQRMGNASALRWFLVVDPFPIVSSCTPASDNLAILTHL